MVEMKWSVARMIGETIAQLRKQKRWSQLIVATRLGIAKSTYAGYESGYREPSLDTLRQLAELFEVSLDRMVGQREAGQSVPEPTRAVATEPDDPELGIWFKELLEAPEERREELRKIWEIIKIREAERKPGDKQGE
ncbi:helix-turn-helix transcriptional regulator [Paenibacillus hemerocallicola]|uniref:Helix-turn-helix transcriptional regulator n=2 Tax=Paenibacillus hemerocallicola TaxID=1172614 RepID=A0A5C4T995_9BACL|nr:helix-turn-helix transcriptional regulator [Paenibacillus hemerocallicola]